MKTTNRPTLVLNNKGPRKANDGKDVFANMIAHRKIQDIQEDEIEEKENETEVSCTFLAYIFRLNHQLKLISHFLVDENNANIIVDQNEVEESNREVVVEDAVISTQEAEALEGFRKI